jgi:hypothetical protein
MPYHEPGPLSLSDEQLSVITRLAEPLAPRDRSAFPAALAQLLHHERGLWVTLARRSWRALATDEAGAELQATKKAPHFTNAALKARDCGRMTVSLFSCRHGRSGSIARARLRVSMGSREKGPTRVWALVDVGPLS